jgi:hypothetical protein
VRRIHGLRKAWTTAGDERFIRRVTEFLPARGRLLVAVVLTAAYVGVSFASGVRHFVSRDVDVPLFTSLDRALSSFRVINSYHLFAHITRERIEPEFQTNDGGGWTPLSLHYKPGPVERSPAFVAPHQPRVDFQLWFYGLNHGRRPPLYVVNLLHRLCEQPGVVAPLFVETLPAEPEQVRVAFFRYHYTSRQEREVTRQVWTREPVGHPRVLRCPGPTQGASK